MKILKRILKITAISLAVFLGLVLIFVVISVAPINRTPAQDFPAYSQMMNRLDSVESITIPSAEKKITVGYSKINLTPPFRTATAGYGKRKGKPFTSVHDSIFVRTMVFDNGTQHVAVVSADLLIIPPTVTRVLRQRLPEIGFSLDNTFLGATHSHNSIGNWGEGLTRFLYGAYEDTVVNFIADKILRSISEASHNMLPATIRTGTVSIPETVDNRLIDGGPEDPLLRAIEIHRSDSSKLVFMNYTAHATCLFSNDFALSRDYPGRLVDRMEEYGYTFAMFMAGAVGSHSCEAPHYGESCVDWMADHISDRVLASTKNFTPVTDQTLWMIKVPLSLADPQVKLTHRLKARAWLFRSTFGEYPAFLTAFRIGDVVLLGTPCDFSGEFDIELDDFAKAHDLKIMVTSFNGGYIGYVTPEKYFDVDHYETQLMNWYPPGNGEYLKTCLEKLILASDGK
jgi:neutral ceramidase